MTPIHNIEHVLSHWGKSQHQLPQDNQTLKNNLLNRLSVNKIMPPNNIRLPWLSVTFASLSVISFILFATNQKTIVSPQLAKKNNIVSEPTSTSSQTDSGLSLQQSESAKNSSTFFPAQPPAEIPITDNRELLKTDYSANIESRHVIKLTERLQTTIRGFGGRVDTSYSNKESGSITFVVPATKLDAFKAELTSIAGSRFVTESISNENLLPQKKNLEKQHVDLKLSQQELNTQRESLTATHATALTNLQTQINSINRRIKALETELANNPDQFTEITAQKTGLEQRRNNISSQIIRENEEYNNNLNLLNSRVQGVEDSLKNNSEQDTNLTDSAATVRGTITVSHINLWELITKYIPGYLIPLCFLITALASYGIKKYRSARLSLY